MSPVLPRAPIGQKFNRLLVVAELTPRLRKDGRRLSLWRFRCDCGKTVDVVASSVRLGRTKSCGCLNDEKRIVTGRAKATHGATRFGTETPEYRTWKAMIQRCEYPGAPSYPQYGGRGIRICDPWRHSFETFFADMGPKPSPAHSMDRLDSAGNYEPGNCRWATRTEQNRNRSSVVLTAEKAAEIRSLRDANGWGRRRIAAHLSLPMGAVVGALAGSWSK